MDAGDSDADPERTNIPVFLDTSIGLSLCGARSPWAYVLCFFYVTGNGAYDVKPPAGGTLRAEETGC